jgi:hypothetical protein
VFSAPATQNGGIAMSRSYWQQSASTVMTSGNGYANVAFNVSIDVLSRAMVLDAAVHFPVGTTAPASVNFQAALMQSNILGPQVGAATYYPENMVGNDYKHNHTLRHYITGAQAGTVISTTTAGSTWTQQYNYNIPATINGVPVELADLEVVAWVMNGTMNIENTDNAPITWILPGGAQQVDLEASTNMTMPTTYCDGLVTPEITVENKGSVAVSTYDVSYRVNGGSATTLTISTPINPGGTATHPFTAVTLPAGASTITYSVEVDNTTTYFDMTPANDNVSSDEILLFGSGTAGTDLEEDFQNNAPGDRNIADAILTGGDDRIYAFDNTLALAGTNWDLGGFEQSTRSIRAQLYNIGVGVEGELIFKNLDLSSSVNSGLVFSYAYAQQASNNNDRLDIRVSTDCGVSWNVEFNKAGANLKTADALSAGTSPFYPHEEDWVSQYIDLSSYDSEPEVMVAFRITGDQGNALYLDDINIGADVAAGIDENETVSALGVYPNPTNGNTVVSFDLDNATMVAMTVTNVLGETVIENAPAIRSAGVNKFTVEAANLNDGLYFVNLTVGDKVVTEKFTVLK